MAAREPSPYVPNDVSGDQRCAGVSLHGPRELVSPFALLVLVDAPGHGYALAARLRSFGFDWGGPGPLYNHLRDLERRDLVSSSMSPGQAGPVRRTYALTSSGCAALRSYDSSIRALRQLLAQLLREAAAATWLRDASTASFDGQVVVDAPSAPAPSAMTVITPHASTSPQRRRKDVPRTGEISYPREMVLGGILTIVAKAPSDSARITAQLAHLGFVWEGVGPVFTHLHALTAACLLTVGSPAGPAGRRGRRVYGLSPAGRLAMPAWVDSLDQLHWKLTNWSQEYARLATLLDRTPHAEA